MGSPSVGPPQPSHIPGLDSVGPRISDPALAQSLSPDRCPHSILLQRPESRRVSARNPPLVPKTGAFPSQSHRGQPPLSGGGSCVLPWLRPKTWGLPDPFLCLPLQAPCPVILARPSQCIQIPPTSPRLSPGRFRQPPKGSLCFLPAPA